MKEETELNERVTNAMRHREITLADGRYMIFYTFDDDGGRCEEANSDQGEDV